VRRRAVAACRVADAGQPGSPRRNAAVARTRDAPGSGCSAATGLRQFADAVQDDAGLILGGPLEQSRRRVVPSVPTGRLPGLTYGSLAGMRDVRLCEMRGNIRFGSFEEADESAAAVLDFRRH
jgi:hypothetical protein